MEKNRLLILKVLVGSRAHGLHTETSDYDYRGVYVTPTSEILSIGHQYKGSHWLEGDEDQTTYEIGHFLHLATKCNPSILEVFVAPIVNDFSFNTSLNYHNELRELFPHVWNPNDAYNAFVGYGLNQRKKMLDNHLDRWKKYALAYVRTLYNLQDLLKNETFSLEVTNLRLGICLAIKNGQMSVGDIINLTNHLTEDAKYLRDKCKHEPDLKKVNDFLLTVRQQYW